MSTLNSRLQLSIINHKKGNNLLEKGFTLVELMIVIVVVGVLSSVALPQFLGVKDKAERGSEIGEFVGLAKECSTAIIIDGPFPANYDASILAKTPGVNINCNSATGGPAAPVIFTSEAIPNDLDGAIRCGANATLTIATPKCEITVKNTDGSIAFLPVA